MIKSSQLKHDHEMMHRAIELARRGVTTTRPNPAVGCIISKGGQVVGEGWHYLAGEPHAEVHALRQAGAAAKGATAYVTLEPCSHTGRTPPCANALIDAGVARVVVAMHDPNPQVSGNGIKRLHDAGIDVLVGVLEQSAEQLNPGFLSRMRHQRPFVSIKMASSLDGKTALSDGRSQWITGPQARADVQYWRAQADAILTGADTILKDNPMLTVRESQWPATRALPNPLQQPIRIVIDSQNRVTDDAKVFESPAPVWLVRCQPGQPSQHAHCHEVLIARADNGKIDLDLLMRELAKREVNQVWTECGASLAAALVESDFCDRLMMYHSGQILGNEARSLFDTVEPEALDKAVRFKIVERRQVGDDQRVIAVPQHIKG